jgi:hypothetical protein
MRASKHQGCNKGKGGKTPAKTAGGCISPHLLLFNGETTARTAWTSENTKEIMARRGVAVRNSTGLFRFAGKLRGKTPIERRLLTPHSPTQQVTVRLNFSLEPAKSVDGHYLEDCWRFSVSRIAQALMPTLEGDFLRRRDHRQWSSSTRVGGLCLRTGTFAFLTAPRRSHCAWGQRDDEGEMPL